MFILLADVKAILPSLSPDSLAFLYGKNVKYYLSRWGDYLSCACNESHLCTVLCLHNLGYSNIRFIDLPRIYNDPYKFISIFWRPKYDELCYADFSKNVEACHHIFYWSCSWSISVFFSAFQIFFLSIFSTQLTWWDISYVTHFTIGSELTFSNFTCIYR